MKVPFRESDCRHLGGLVSKFDSEYECIGVERVHCHRKASERIGSDHHRLRRAELIFSDYLDVRVNKELHGGSDAVTCHIGGAIEWRAGEASRNQRVVMIGV